jgi:hypothetical protein
MNAGSRVQQWFYDLFITTQVARVQGSGFRKEAVAGVWSPPA